MRLRFGLASLLLLVASGPVALGFEPVPEEQPTAPPRQPVESQVVLPVLTEGDKPRREVTAEGFKVELDLSMQVLSLDVPQDESWREPDEIRANDTVEVLAEDTALKQGRQVVARLAKGQRLPVLRVRGDWIGAAIAVGGQRKAGWVKRDQVRFVEEEAAIHKTLSGLSGGGFVSAALLAQKAKQFDDGLYAAVELAAQEGAGEFAGKTLLLRTLAHQVAAGPSGQIDQPRQVVLAAASLGAVGVEVSPEVEKTYAELLAGFTADPLRSKPIGCYTWSDDLSRIFRQDRILQMELSGKPGIEAVLRLLHSDPAAREVYEGYLNLVARLTNPLSHADLRPALTALDSDSDGGSADAPERQVRFFPPSRSHETDLILRLYGNQPIPDDFSLVDEVIARVRAGDLDLSPRPDSGWYDHQTWAIEPLIVPERSAEASRLSLSESYKKHLEELFKGVYALTRETHIKQLDIPLAAAEEGPVEEPRPQVYIAPELTVEPLATYYLRRAAAYRFVRGVLDETFGPEALAGMHRQTAAGPVEPDLASELADMEALFQGAHLAACLQAGLAPDASLLGGQSDADAKRFLNWAANTELDSDLGRDARMMVPVFYDLQRKKTKVWLFLGWSSQRLTVSFAQPPGVRTFDAAGAPVLEQAGPEVLFYPTSYPLVSAVMAEVYVDKILNRDEFRQHCDQYRTRSAILANLQ